MWRPTDNTGIPPNLLRNFNVFEVLEPQRNGAKNSGELKVDKLVDIDECSRDSGFQDSELNASFTDKKRDFDLIDLYENMFVTPHHVKQRCTESSNVSNVDANNVSDNDFKQFFDQLEFDQKIDNTESECSNKKATPNYDFNGLKKKPKILVPKVFDESDSDPEDLINEVLAQKNIEKQFIDKIRCSPKVNLDFPKKIKTSEIGTDFGRLRLNNNATQDLKFNENNNKNTPHSSNLRTLAPVNDITKESIGNFTLLAMQKDEKIYKKKRLIKPESQTSKYTKGPDFYEKSIVLPQIMVRMNARKAYLEETLNQKKRLILDAGKETKTASCSKSIGRRSIDSKTSKSNVDDEFIRNGAEVKSCENCGKKDTSTPTTSKNVDDDFGKLSPTVLMQDCNKERYKEWKKSQMFKNLVLKGHYES